MTSLEINNRIHKWETETGRQIRISDTSYDEEEKRYRIEFCDFIAKLFKESGVLCTQTTKRSQNG